MDDLQFHIEWLEPNGISGPELSATWCRLQVVLNGNNLFHLYDETSKSVRNGIYFPAYVLAEWIVDRFYFFMLEYPGSGIREPEFPYRHNLLYNREGYLFPELNIYPKDQSTIAIDVAPARYEFEKKAFLEKKHYFCSRSSFEAGVRHFMNSVTARLEDCEVPDSYVAQRWSELTPCLPDERIFIESTAALGKHYADLTEVEEAAFLEASEGVPEDLILEFSRHLTFPEYLQQFRSLAALALEMRDHASMTQRLPEIRRELLGNAQRSRIPWDYGYTLARTLRTLLKANEMSFDSVMEIDRFIGIIPSLAQREHPSLDPQSSLHAVLIVPEENRWSLALKETARASSQMFTYCRALGEYFAMGEKKVGVVSSIDSWGQQLNRAFAAEFLLPVHLLRERIPGSIVHSERIEDLATEFHVSAILIRHQLENQTSIRVIEEE
ncbi:MAG: hypothetical protein WAV84_01070 [Bacteroidota bacterium]